MLCATLHPMLRHKLFLILILFCSTVSTNGQKVKDTSKVNSDIFLGQISGVSANQFNDEFSYDTFFGLDRLTESKNLIEIRFFEISNIPWYYCTTLYYDTEFKLSRKSYQVRQYDTAKLKLFEFQPLAKMNADSVLSKLVQNSIFSYEPSNYFDNKPKILTTKGIEVDTKLCGQTDGFSYYIDIKVGNTYKRIFSRSDRQFLSECYPDNSDFKKEAAFIRLLETRPLIRTK